MTITLEVLIGREAYSRSIVDHRGDPVGGVIVDILPDGAVTVISRYVGCDRPGWRHRLEADDINTDTITATPTRSIEKLVRQLGEAIAGQRHAPASLGELTTWARRLAGCL
jgi:hypothetical protein